MPAKLNNSKDGKSIIMGQLFQKIEMVEDGRIEFQFTLAAPYIFELQQTYNVEIKRILYDKI